MRGEMLITTDATKTRPLYLMQPQGNERGRDRKYILLVVSSLFEDPLAQKEKKISSEFSCLVPHVAQALQQGNHFNFVFISNTNTSTLVQGNISH